MQSPPPPIGTRTWQELDHHFAELLEQREIEAPSKALLAEIEIARDELRRQHQSLIGLQAALEQSRHRYVELFESTPLGYVVLAEHDSILEVNLTAAKLFGRRRALLVGTSLAKLVRDPEIVRCHLAELFRTGGPTHHFVRLQRLDGSAVAVELCSRRSLDGARALVAMIDPRDKQQDQHELARLALREKSAREANLASARFCAMLAHELRTPLAPLVSSAEVLEQDPNLPAHLAPVVARLRRNADAQARLIREFLEAQRAHHGGLEIRPERSDMHALISETLGALGSDAAVVELQLAAARVCIDADPVRMAQILTNLMRNALAAVRGGGRVWITTENPDPTSIRVTVADSGVGMDPDTLRRIFAPFERGPTQLPDRPEGLGLGLWICKSLIEAHHGQIRAESAGIGHGSRFLVDFPLRIDATDPVPAPQGAAQAAPPVQESTDKSLRLLVVDDHVDSAEALACLLELTGHDVVIAHDFGHALEHAKRHLDLLIIDLYLQDGDGRTLLAELRKRNCACPAIILSGAASSKDIEQSRRAGFVDHLSKPIDRNALLAAIEHARRSRPT